MNVSATVIYVVSCSVAAGMVAIGLVAANIAMLLVLVVMMGVCAVGFGRKKR